MMLKNLGSGTLVPPNVYTCRKVRTYLSVVMFGGTDRNANQWHSPLRVPLSKREVALYEI